jgi:hypothetical protein
VNAGQLAEAEAAFATSCRNLPRRPFPGVLRHFYGSESAWSARKRFHVSSPRSEASGKASPYALAKARTSALAAVPLLGCLLAD